jgi:hypothetical protein
MNVMVIAKNATHIVSTVGIYCLGKNFEDQKFLQLNQEKHLTILKIYKLENESRNAVYVSKNQSLWTDGVEIVVSVLIPFVD